MYDLSGELTVILITIWRWQKLQTVSKQRAQKSDTGRFNLRKLNELEVRKHYQIKISNRFAALDNLNNSDDINRAWENIKDDIKTSDQESLGLYELNQHTSWFDEEYSGVFRPNEVR